MSQQFELAARNSARAGTTPAGWLSCVQLLILGLGTATACKDGVATQTLTEPSSGRQYEVVTRPKHDSKQPASVLFALHAYGTAADVMPAAWALREHAVATRGMLLVVPAGLKDDLGKPFWNASAACCGELAKLPDDLAYLRGVLSDLRKHFAIDPERVYALGLSNGAFMAHRWACTPGGDLRGIVAVSGSGPGASDAPCTPTVPVRVLQIHGDADEVIRYEGGQGIRGPYPSASATVQRWRELNQCESAQQEPSRWSVSHGSTHKLSAKSATSEVVLWTFEGGTHGLRSIRSAMPELLEFLERR